MGTIFNPNDNFKNGVVDQSDLTTFINLTVSLPERPFTHFTKSKEISLMDIDYNKSLTTGYVDINLYEDRRIKNSELFGINNIDISFNTSFHPVVKINFTDVKGYELFNKNENDTATSFFKSFFHFPYPKFTLKVKGYYGPTVSFDLKVLNFDSEFMSDTGNYNITVEFLGDIYGVLGDIPLTFIMFSPYMIEIDSEGKNVLKKKKIWETHVGNYENKIGFKSPTLLEVIDKVNNFANIEFDAYEKEAFNIVLNAESEIGNYEIIKDIVSDTNTFVTLISNINSRIKPGGYEGVYEEVGESHWDVFNSKDGKYKYIFADSLKEGSFLKNLSDFLDKFNNIDMSMLSGDERQLLSAFNDIKVFSIHQLASKYGISAKEKFDDLLGVDNCDLILNFLKKHRGSKIENYWEINTNGQKTCTDKPNSFFTKIDFNSESNKYSIAISPYEQTFNRLYMFRIPPENLQNITLEDGKKICKELGLDENNVMIPSFLQECFDNNEMTEKEIIKYGGGENGVKYIYIDSVNCDVTSDIFNADEFKNSLYIYLIKRGEKINEINEKLINRRIIAIPTSINIESVNASINEFNKKIREKESFKDKGALVLNKIIKNHLNYTPTIKNISNIILCNLDFFLKDILGLINHILRNDENRRIVLNEKIMRDYKGDLMPPFPMVALNNGGDNNKVFPGIIDVISGITEVGYVNNLYNIISFYRDKSKQYATSNIGKDVKFTKVLPSDMLYDINPYYYNSTSPNIIYNHITKVLGERLVHNDYYYNYEETPTLGKLIQSEWENLIKPVIEYYDDIRIKNLFNNSNKLLEDISYPCAKMRNEYYYPNNDKLFVGGISGEREGFKEKYITKLNETNYTNIYGMSVLKDENNKYSLNIGNKNESVLNGLETNQRYEILAYTILYNEKFKDIVDFNNIIKLSDGYYSFKEYSGEFIYETKVLWLLRIGCYLYFNKKNSSEGLSNSDKAFYNHFNNIGICNGVELNTDAFNEKVCINLFKSWVDSLGTVDIGGNEKIFSLKQIFKIKTDTKIECIYGSDTTTLSEEPLFHNAYVYAFPNKIDRESKCSNMNANAFSTIIKGISDLDLDNSKFNEDIIKNDISFENSIKASLYYSLKHIVDNYINDIAYDITQKISFSDKMSIRCVDSYMNNIEETSFVDLKNVVDIISNGYIETPSLSVLQLLTKISEKNKYLAILAPLNLFNGDIRGMFEVKTKYDKGEEMHTSLTFYKYSEDSFLKNNGGYEKNTMDDISTYQINAFEVSYGDITNNIFYGLSMNMNSSVSTEESIANTLFLSKGGDDATTLNLYDIFKERSYKVNLTMMGNPNITPLMFFSLKHIPMYNGIYRIINVSHNITPNNFITNVTGVGVNKYSSPKESETNLIYNLIRDFAGKLNLNEEDKETIRGKTSDEILDHVMKTKVADGTSSLSYNLKDTVRHVDEVDCDNINSMIKYIRRNAIANGRFAIDGNYVQKSILYMLCKIIKEWNENENTKITVTSLLRKGELKDGRTTYGSAHNYGLAADIQIIKGGRVAHEENLRLFKMVIKYLGTNYKNECDCDIDRVIWEYKKQWNYKDSHPQWIHIGMSSGSVNKIYGVDVNSAYMGKPEKKLLAGIQNGAKYINLIGGNRPSVFVEIGEKAGLLKKQ